MHRLRCFGRIVVEDDGGERVRLRSRKHLALLLYLASHRDRRHDRERVSRLFWQTKPSLARHSLSQALYDIRNQVPDLELDRTNREVGLGENGLTFEAREFERAIREDDLGRASRLYDGPFAPDLEAVGGADFERWLEQERNRYRRLAEKALLRRVSECADAGRWGEMCMAGSRLVSMNPLNEEAHRAVIRGLWLQGDRSGALAHFDEHAEFLRAELPNGLSDETRELVHRIRAAVESAEPAAVREKLRPEMVGREEEFGQLKDALADAQEGHSRFVVVKGEAGIGKTRLLEEFAEIATLEDVRLLESRCYAAESDLPYGPIVDALQGLASEVAEQAEEQDQSYYQLGHLFPEAFGKPEIKEFSVQADIEAGKRRLHEELGHLLLASGPNPVLVIDDYQWIDQASASVLRYLAHRSGDFPFLIVLSTRPRPHVGAHSSEYEFWTSSPKSIAPTVIELEPLTTEHTRALVEQYQSQLGHQLETDALSKRIDELHSLTGGNPYFLTQLCVKGVELTAEGQELGATHSIPDEMIQVVKGRFESLPNRERQLLEAVAVSDRYAYPNLLKNICELTNLQFLAAARRLYEEGLLKNNPDKLEFNHEIARNHAYEGIDEFRRTMLHAAVGEVLEQDYDNVDPTTLARHFYLGHETDQAFQYAMQAATEAEKRYAHSEAIAAAQMALESATNGTEKVNALNVLAVAKIASGRYDEAEGHLKQLLEQGECEGEQEIKVRIRLLKIYVDRFAWSSANEQIDILNDCFTGVGIEDALLPAYVQFLQFRLKAAMRSLDRESASATVTEIRKFMGSNLTNQLPDVVQIVNTTSLAAYETLYESSSAAWDTLKGIEQFDKTRLTRDEEFRVWLVKGLVGVRKGCLDKGKHYLHQALKIARSCNDADGMANVYNNLAAVNLSRGNWDEVDECYNKLSTLVEGNEHSIYWRLLGQINYGESLVYRGKLKAGVEEFREIHQAGETLEGWDNAVKVHANLGLASLARGNDGEAEFWWSKVKSDMKEGLRGTQGRFKKSWFEAVMARKQGEDSAWRLLYEQGKKEYDFERAEALYSLWIAELMRAHEEGSLDDEELLESDVAEEIRELGMAWFLYYGRRWVRRSLP